jgi:hypothetical protein
MVLPDRRASVKEQALNNIDMRDCVTRSLKGFVTFGTTFPCLFPSLNARRVILILQHVQFIVKYVHISLQLTKSVRTPK